LDILKGKLESEGDGGSLSTADVEILALVGFIEAVAAASGSA
jgi:hypothetical protein